MELYASRIVILFLSICEQITVCTIHMWNVIFFRKKNKKTLSFVTLCKLRNIGLFNQGFCINLYHIRINYLKLIERIEHSSLQVQIMKHLHATLIMTKSLRIT